MQGGPRFPLPIAPYPDRYPPPFIIHSGMQPFPWSPFKCQAIEVQTSFHRAFCQLHNSHGFKCILWYGAFKVLLPMQLHCSLFVWEHLIPSPRGQRRLTSMTTLLAARRSTLEAFPAFSRFLFRFRTYIYIYMYMYIHCVTRWIGSFDRGERSEASLPAPSQHASPEP